MVNILRLSAVLLLWVVSAHAIIGDAENVHPGEYDNVVSLTYNGKHFCTGTLISPGVVLSAAHCFNMNPKIKSKKKLVDNVQIKFPGGNSVGVVDFKTHSDFFIPFGAFAGNAEAKKLANENIYRKFLKGEMNQVYHGDLALVYLNKCVTDVRPVHLRFRKPGDAELTCEHGTAVGYGNIHFDGKWRGPTKALETVSVARKATVRIHSAEACEQLLSFYLIKRMSESKHLATVFKLFPKLKLRVEKFIREEVTKAHQLKGRPVVCNAPTTNKLQSTSKGDSGGPIFVDGVQVGVSSQSGGLSFSSYGGYGEGYLSYHTRVDGYLEWIEKYAVERCESMASASRRLRGRGLFSLPPKLGENIWNNSDKKVRKAIQLLNDFDKCPVSGTSFQ
jgi:hypothetical protein